MPQNVSLFAPKLSKLKLNHGRIQLTFATSIFADQNICILIGCQNTDDKLHLPVTTCH